MLSRLLGRQARACESSFDADFPRIILEAGMLAVLAVK